MKKYGWIILITMSLLAGCGSQAAAEKSDMTENSQPEAAAINETPENSQSEAAAMNETSEAAQTENAAENEQAADPSEGISYQHISQQEAKRIMEEEEGFIILDVRTFDEYKEGHIPGAICVPNESIGEGEIQKLPDKDQKILVYCRSGVRSKKASEKLAGLGYTNILEFGGILDWTGEVVSEPDEGEKTLRLMIGDREMPVTWEDNASVDELKEFVFENEPVIEMSMYGGFEQVGPLGAQIVRDDVQTTTEAGDIVLYAGDQIVVFYGSNTWAYTRLGHIELSAEELTELLGSENVTLTLTLTQENDL